MSLSLTSIISICEFYLLLDGYPLSESMEVGRGRYRT